MDGKKKLRRIGPQMEAAVAYVKRHPGCTKYEVSKAIGPNGSNSYGWQIIRRCLEADLLEDKGTDLKSALYVKQGNE